MDQYIDNRHKEIFYHLLDNPADTGRLHVTTLERMVHDNPQSGLLQVMLARAGGSEDAKRAAIYFKPGTLHKLLHNADNLPLVAPKRIMAAGGHPSKNYFSDSLTQATAAATPVFDQDEPENTDTAKLPAEDDTANIREANGSDTEPEAALIPDRETPEVDSQDSEDIELQQAGSSTEIEEEVHDEIQSSDVVIPELYQSYQEQLTHPETGEPVLAEQHTEEPDTFIPELYEAYQEQLNHQDDEADETSSTAADEQPEVAEEEQSSAISETQQAQPVTKGEDIDEEVYDEIVGIDDIGFTPTVNVLHESEEPQPEDSGIGEQTWQNTFSDDEEYPEDEEDDDERPLQRSAGITDQDIAIDEEKLILGNIVSADYLSFDKKLDELRSNDKANGQPYEAPLTAETTTEPEAVKEQDVVSRYNDDTMPYSFMWWLDKTRKEHADSFQPYITNPSARLSGGVDGAAKQPGHQRVKPVKRKAPDELQQQYYENIFSLTSVSGIERDDTDKGLEFDHNKKEDVIIERFIHNEPQIRPPAADRLDNENKAKKSSEDQDALVTETLARIYTDQMLYHKAIATYKKLILKFPEKKLYFAAQIEQLEKKTN